jgi:hypothetical protein
MRTNAIVNLVLSNRDSSAAPYSLMALRAPGVQHLKKAFIATTPFLKDNPDVRRGSKIDIVGYDGPNFGEKYKHWIPVLKTWLETGCDVRYLLLHPGARAKQSLGDLASEFNQCGGKLTVFTVKNKPKPPRAISDLLIHWKTFHFAVFDKPRQLWIETYHAPGKTFAKDCYFFPKAAAARPGILDVYKSQLQTVIAEYSRRLIPAQDAKAVSSHTKKPSKRRPHASAQAKECLRGKEHAFGIRSPAGPT